MALVRQIVYLKYFFFKGKRKSNLGLVLYKMKITPLTRLLVSRHLLFI